MVQVNVYDVEGKKQSELSLDGRVFDSKISEYSIYQLVRLQQANRRQGNASTKERSDVSGGGQKLYRQKGTGRARAGTSRSPIRRGGGVAFGPHPRSYTFKLPKKVKRLAYRSVLTGKLRDDAFTVIEKWDVNPAKTKRVSEIMDSISAGQKVLVILDKAERDVQMLARNIYYVSVIGIENINIIDLLDCDNIVCSKDAILKIQEMFLNEN